MARRDTLTLGPGLRVPDSIITETVGILAEIRAAQSVGQRALAAAYGCSQSAIWRLRHGKVRS